MKGRTDVVGQMNERLVGLGETSLWPPSWKLADMDGRGLGHSK